MPPPTGTLNGHYSRLCLLAAVIAGITASIVSCGGGGGGASAQSGAVVYAGNTEFAIVTSGNAAKLASNIFGGGDEANVIGGALAGVATGSGDVSQDGRAQRSGVVDLSLRLNRNFREIVERAKRANSSQAPVVSVIAVDDTEPCDTNLGSTRISGTLNDDSTGTVTVTFNSCLIDDVTLNGPATMRISVFDTGLAIPTDFTVAFERLTLRGPGVSVDIGGAIRFQTNTGLNTEALTVNVVSRDNSTGEATKTENLLILIESGSMASFTEKVSGRIFDQIHGYVDITTPIPLAFSSFSQMFPDTGQILLIGQGSRSIEITSRSATLTTFALDLDSDGIDDVNATLLWADLSGRRGSDLADNDGDRMHNSWESANGLNPNYAADAALDDDGDSVSNLSEYLAGTDPKSIISTPVNLSISMSASPDPVFVGGNLSYSITVTNPGALAANNVVVADALPHGMQLVSVVTSQGNCILTGPVICNLGTVFGFASVFITIGTTPTEEGVIDNTATLSSRTPDPDFSDNVATTTTTTARATADLSITASESADPVAESETFTYELLVRNSGPGLANDVRIEDILPVGVSFVSAKGAGWQCGNNLGTVNCFRASLGVNAVSKIDIEVIAELAAGSLSNTASVSSNALDPNVGNNSATETTTIIPTATSTILDFGAPVVDMALDAARQQLYVSVPESNEVAIVSLNTWTVISRVVVGSRPHGIDLSHDGDLLYAALRQGSAVAVLDLSVLSVSEIVVGPELGTSQTYDVSASTPSAVFVSGNPGSSGIAYLLKIDTANGNLVTRVANNRIIRADPFFVASADQQYLYVGEGFSPNSVYKLDLTQPDVPLIGEDIHGDLIYGGAEHLAIDPDGSRLFLASGQVLRTSTLTGAGLIQRGVSRVSSDGTKIYVASAPNRIRVYDSSTLLEIDTIATACDISDIERIIEIQPNISWALLGGQRVCRVDP